MAHITGDEASQITRAQQPSEDVTPPSTLAVMLDSDIWHSFKKSKITILAAIVTLLIFAAALFAPVIAPQNPFDPINLSLIDSLCILIWRRN